MGAVLLNPSTADCFADDRTTALMISVAAMGGFGSLIQVNLHDFVSTDPVVLKMAVVPVSHECDRFIEYMMGAAKLVIVGWGNDGNFMGRADQFLKKYKNQDFYCFGQNKNGSPRFPRALKKPITIIPYERRPSDGGKT